MKETGYHCNNIKNRITGTRTIGKTFATWFVQVLEEDI